MNRIDDEIDATLRSLDPAHPRIDASGPRARADLHTILATAPAVPDSGAALQHSAVTGRPRGAARTTRRVAVIGGLAATVAAGIVALPPLIGGDEAFATWTPVPEAVSAQQRPEAGAECRKEMEDGAGAQYADDLGSADVAIAESRGVWTTVVLAGADGFSALCITDGSAGLFAAGMIGSIGAPHGLDGVSPGARELFPTDLGVGSMNDRDISLAAGQAGPDVVGVVYRSQAHGDVAATVSHGRFAVWLPGDEFEGASSGGVEVDVTYRDGSTAVDVLKLDDV
ncbi:hypothetical protein ATJ97_0522 [Georgenia soli]|uniref:Uncharacterized protein n=1 Tax=Georgenia soli TaxID=638953 RepID=A0A2A9EIH0_9MICO|nr:hypothetical protein [Georgenia soli]PFG38052.1 hypothetical protein ATJ97_0522 [Georgenia soli]